MPSIEKPTYHIKQGMSPTQFEIQKNLIEAEVNLIPENPSDELNLLKRYIQAIKRLQLLPRQHRDSFRTFARDGRFFIALSEIRQEEKLTWGAAYFRLLTNDHTGNDIFLRSQYHRKIENILTGQSQE